METDFVVVGAEQDIGWVQSFYKLELNRDTIPFILHPLLCGEMTCFDIFGGGILTNLCLVSFCASLIYIHVSRFVIHFKN